MSAIAGILNFHNDSAYEDGRNVMQALERYPSDDTSIWYTHSIFIGCVAQWITPESVNHPLPFYYVDPQLVITADAIIDNRKDLFDRLQIDLHTQKRMSDSELILLAYQKWGLDMTKYLIGDYAFVIWDESKRIMFGSRDPLGNRTLYYRHDHQNFSFCSLIAPLFTISNVHKQLNQTWLADFLAISDMYETNDSSSTPYKDIQQLPPGHNFIVKDGKVNLTRNNTLIPTEKLMLTSNGEYLEAFQDLFQEATKARLRTHRQIGATLSGGLDSGAVVSCAANALRVNNKILHTYSYIPPDDFKDWTGKSRVADERPYIKAIVNHVGNINDNYVNLPGISPITEIDSLLELLEVPYKNFENSFWIKGIYEVACQDNIGILLTGARGNHTISWGSVTNYCVHLLRRFKYIRFYQEMKLFSRQISIRRSRLFPILAKSAYPLLDIRSKAMNEHEVPHLINPNFAKTTKVYEKLKSENNRLPFTSNDFMKDRESYFTNGALVSMQGSFGAKLSLRYGLWERDATSDERIIRFCLSLPIEQYIQQGIGRSLVRRATEYHLPSQVRLNQHIRGVQGVDWVHRMLPAWNEFHKEIVELCSDPKAAYYLNTDRIKQALASKGNSPKPEQALDFEMRFLMRSVIVYRFLKAI